MTKQAKYQDAPVQKGDTLLLHHFGIAKATQIRADENEPVVHVVTHAGEKLQLSMGAAARRRVG